MNQLNFDHDPADLAVRRVQGLGSLPVSNYVRAQQPEL